MNSLLFILWILLVVTRIAVVPAVQTTDLLCAEGHKRREQGNCRRS
jgi:hypothetical protein